MASIHAHAVYIKTAVINVRLGTEPEVVKTWTAVALLGRLGVPDDFKAPAMFL